jgi:hypothetical protein
VNPGLDERLEPLLAYWFVKCAGRPMPARGDLHADEWERWHGNIALFDVIRYGALRIHECRLSASGLLGRLGREATGLSIDQLATEIRIALRTSFENACERRAPVIAESRVMIAGRGALYSDLILPLSADGHNVDAILLGSYPRGVQKL